MFSVDPLSPSICHWISSSVGKIKPELVGKCMHGGWPWHVKVLRRLSLEGLGSFLVFWIMQGFQQLVVLLPPKLWYLHMPSAGFWNSWKGLGQMLGIVTLFVVPLSLAWFGLLLWLAVAAATVGSLLPWVSHKESASLTIAMAVLGLQHIPPLSWRTAVWKKKHGKKKVVVRTNSIGQKLLQFAHEIARLRPSMPRMSQQFKIGLSLAFAKLSQQNSFEIIERALRHITSINCV